MVRLACSPHKFPYRPFSSFVRIAWFATSLLVTALLAACNGDRPGLPDLGPAATATSAVSPPFVPTSIPTPLPSPTPPHPLTIDFLRQQPSPGSDVVIEETLKPGSNYARYISSYQSEGLKIFAMLTVPNGPKPPSGWPVIVFNHGFIPPAQYRTTERYVAYVDAFARSGYIVFRPDYRGNGSSEGAPSGAYGSPGYAIDVLNAMSSIQRYPDADRQRVGMWGHSMGGYLTLRAMVARKDIRAGVIWAGVVGSYSDLVSRWRGPQATPTVTAPTTARRWRSELVERFGSPETNPTFWNSISANPYLAEISGPLQLHHGTSDHSVPLAFSETLAEELKAAGQTYELYTYPGDDHNISKNLTVALKRSVAFFDKYVKDAEVAQAR